jgi:hypothetical protein
MPLLFWYLPFIILSGAYESATAPHDQESSPEQD